MILCSALLSEHWKPRTKDIRVLHHRKFLVYCIHNTWQHAVGYSDRKVRLIGRLSWKLLPDWPLSTVQDTAGPAISRIAEMRTRWKINVWQTNAGEEFAAAGKRC